MTITPFTALLIMLGVIIIAFVVMLLGTYKIPPNKNRSNLRPNPYDND